MSACSSAPTAPDPQTNSDEPVWQEAPERDLAPLNPQTIPEADWESLSTRVRIFPDPIGHQIRVEARFIKPPSPLRLYLPDRWTAHLNLKRSFRDMTAFCGDEEVGVLSDEPDQIHVEHVGCQEILIRYRIVAPHGIDAAIAPSHTARFEPRSGVKEGLRMYGQATLLLPALGQEFQRSGVEVVVPSGWAVATNWTPVRLGRSASVEPVGNRTVWRYVAEDLGHLFDSVVVAGPLRLYGQRLDDGRFLQVALNGPLPVSGEEFIKLVTKLVDSQQRFLPKDWRWPAGTRRLSVIALGTGEGMRLEGGGRRGGFVVEVGMNTEPRELAELIAHEAFHVVNGHLLVHHPDAEYATLWFKEGVTTYIAAQTVVQAKLADESWFRGRISNMISAYYGNPAAMKLPAGKLRDRFWQDTNARRLPYDKGALLGLMLDGALMGENSSSTQAIPGLVRMFHNLLTHIAARGQTYNNDTLHSLVQFLDAEKVVDLKTFWPRFVTGTDALPLRTHLRELDLHLMHGTIRVPYFGFQVNLDRSGSFVTNVDSNGPAAIAGLRRGDRLLEDPALHRARLGTPLRLRVLRGGGPTSIVVSPSQGQRMEYRLNPLKVDGHMRYLELLDK